MIRITAPRRADWLLPGPLITLAANNAQLEEFLKPLGISPYRLATAISVPPRRINEIVHGKRGISPDTALRLARALGTSERFWINLQTRYDLSLEAIKHEQELKRIQPLLSA